MHDAPVTFRHDLAGTPEELWLRWDALAAVPALVIAERPPSALVVVAAHPDDETLGAGGLTATAHDAGVAVHVVVATDGAASHPRSPTTAPAVLAARRAAEVREAVVVTAPGARVHLLGLPDGASATDDPDDGRLARVLQDLAVPGGWIVAPWRGDAHPDHAAAGTAAALAAADTGSLLLEYPIWAWHWGLPGDVRMPWRSARRVELSARARALKAEAAARHRSQLEPLSPLPGDEALLHQDFLAHFDRPFELFFVTPAPEPSC